jgi:hypothetical protein
MIRVPGQYFLERFLYLFIFPASQYLSVKETSVQTDSAANISNAAPEAGVKKICRLNLLTRF